MLCRVGLAAQSNRTKPTVKSLSWINFSDALTTDVESLGQFRCSFLPVMLLNPGGSGGLNKPVDLVFLARNLRTWHHVENVPPLGEANC